MYIEWNEEKNQWLKQVRGVCFEDVQTAIETGNVFADEQHSNQDQYPHQRVYIVRIRDYAYVVPYVKKEDGTRFLKTVIPSRRATKKYITKS